VNSTKTAFLAQTKVDSDFRAAAVLEASSPTPRTLRTLHIRWAGYGLQVERCTITDQSVVREEHGYLTVSALIRPESWTRDCDAVVLEIPAYPFQEAFFPHRNLLKNILALPKAAQLGWRYSILLNFFSRLNRPFIIFDFQDSAGIAARFLPLLKRAATYHKRELPRFPAGAFLHTEHFSIEPWRNRGRYAAEIAKLRPLSFGALCPELPRPTVKKDIDILWGGSIENSPVRERGVRLLHKLANEGLRVRILEAPVAKSEFHELMARTWLTFCPDGNGWQCYRSFEAAMLGSVPLMSNPTIWQDQPFRDSVHCFYYDPEGDALKEVVRAALADHDRLQRMAAAARDFVLTEHSESAVYRRHLAEITANPPLTKTARES
jgi:hypothetical protein